MKVSGFWVVLLFLGTALGLLSFSDYKSSVSVPDDFFARGNDVLAKKGISRQLKEQSHNNPSKNKKLSVADKVNLDDYDPLDPVPSSKASVQPGPIEHGSPLNPCIPKPLPPPGHPNTGA